MRIELRYMDDWAALYINGELAFQYHTIEAPTVLEALGFDYNLENDHAPSLVADYVESHGGYPQTVIELRKVERDEH